MNCKSSSLLADRKSSSVLNNGSSSLLADGKSSSECKVGARPCWLIGRARQNEL